MLETRRLGRTGIEASLLGFGGIPIMRVGMEEARDAIAEALDNYMAWEIYRHF